MYLKYLKRVWYLKRAFEECVVFKAGCGVVLKRVVI